LSRGHRKNGKIRRGDEVKGVGEPHATTRWGGRGVGYCRRERGGELSDFDGFCS